MRTFLLMHQVAPATGHPWWIAEIYETSDGARTRLTSAHFSTEAEAWNKLLELERAHGDRDERS